MPEETPATDPWRLVTRLLTTCGVVALAGAVAAYVSGDEVYVRGDVVRTQLDAVWVLGVLGLGMVIGAFAVVVATAPEPRGPIPSDRP